jgi:hypothetical protein
MYFPQFSPVDVAGANQNAQSFSRNALLNHINSQKLGQDVQTYKREEIARPFIGNAFAAYSTGDADGYKAAVTQLGNVNPEAAMKMVEFDQNSKVRQAQASASNAEKETKWLKLGLDFVGKNAGTIPEQMYGDYRATMVKRFGPGMEAFLPQQYDKAYLDTLREGDYQIVDNGLVIDKKTGKQIYDHRKPQGPQSNPGKILADVKAGLLTPEEGQRALAGNGRGVTVNVGGEGNPSAIGDKKFYETVASKQGEKFNNLIEAGNQANYMLGDIAQLSVLSENVETGKLANLKTQATAWADALNVPLPEGFDKFGDSQAMEAVVNRIIPKLRPPGSGTMSDRDVELFKKSLPGLSTSPAGNRIIIQSLQRIAERSIKEGEIASRVASGEITRAAGEKEISALGAVFTKEEVSGWSAQAKQGPIGQPTKAGNGASSGMAVGTVSNGYRFKGGNPNDPASWEQAQ